MADSRILVPLRITQVSCFPFRKIKKQCCYSRLCSLQHLQQAHQFRRIGKSTASISRPRVFTIPLFLKRKPRHHQHHHQTVIPKSSTLLKYPPTSEDGAHPCYRLIYSHFQTIYIDNLTNTTLDSTVIEKSDILIR
jgi:hypothetical protein